MSTVLKTPRLLAAAKEFNIGKNTLLEYLTDKGFSVTDSPSFKLTEVMYDALQGEFAQDKAAKQKSDAIDLPKGSEAKKKADEAKAAVAKKADAPATPVAEVPEEKPQPATPAPQPEITKQPAEKPEVPVEAPARPEQKPEPEAPQAVAPPRTGSSGRSP